ncbi:MULTISPECIES: hypothetical protein [unclassified Microcystis]|uniref:hypothetical protein n=1 Tax=unclassified Microcystis TaxID=2643300 RepID=UPI0022C30D70|nr:MULTISPECIES: hypothetical protein [unclassified Microcystis]MCZ8024371.1 hypothetical protein [Microcystis sp. LE19-10.1B]MDJ0602569.1 hypothetical protein [Microcystis sp. M53602_WE12]
MPIVFNLERANQLSLLPDKDLAYLCPLIEPYQVTKNLKFLLFLLRKIRLMDSLLRMKIIINFLS